MTTSGRIYGAALNFKGTLAQLGDALYREPYKKPPEAPVLYIKPANTRIGDGGVIPCPRDVQQLRIAGTLGIVFGSPLVTKGDVEGYVIAIDVSVPHSSYFRPAIREKCRDGFCPIAWPPRPLANPDAAEIRIFVNGELRARNTTANLVRPISRLIVDITEFMTFSGGDILLAGEPDNAPLAGPGDRVRVEIEGLGALENTIEVEAE